jgi:dipeptidyl aminopeptidase/acylaminoacyl peptidase
VIDQPASQTITPDDLLGLKFLQSAQLSPDGKTVAYAVAHVDPNGAAAAAGAEEKECVAIWLLSVDTGEARQLTAGAARDTNPQWSPDGSRIAFLSTRGDKPQVYVIAVHGGAARALTSLKQGVAGGPVWSPDGSKIAFTAAPASEPRKPDAPYRITRHLYRFDPLGYLDAVTHDIYVIAAHGGEPIQLTGDDWLNARPQWSPDGRAIGYMASLGPDSHDAFLGRLRVVDLDGAVHDVTGAWGEILSFAWLPDGRRIAFCGKPHGQLIGCKADLWVIDRQGGAPQCRTANLALGVGGALLPDMPALAEYVLAPKIVVAAHGEVAYTRVQARGTEPIFRVDLQGPESHVPLVGGERACFLLDLAGDRLLFAASTLFNPADLYVAKVDGADERQLTHLNAELLAARAQPTLKHLAFAGAEGVEVEGWILLPAGGTAPYPTILYIHGGPHFAFGHIYSFDFQMLAGAGYAVLFINQRGSTGYGEEFANQIVGDWGNLDYKDLMAGVDFVVAQGIADPARLGCCGRSAGGYMTCWIVGQTGRFKAAVPECPATNLTSLYGVTDLGAWFAVAHFGAPPHAIPEVYRRCSPITYAHRCTTPVLLIHGEADYRTAIEQSEQFYTVLKAGGCTVEMLRIPGSPHAGTIHGKPLFRRAQNEALLDWMNRYVLGSS